MGTNPLKYRNGTKRGEMLMPSKHSHIPPVLHDTRMPAKVDFARAMNIKKGDLVQVLYGTQAGKQGVVRAIVQKRNSGSSVVVHGMCMKKTLRVKARNQSEQYVTKELPIHCTNVAHVDPVIKKPTRVKRRYTMSGECVRISRVSGCALPEPCKDAIKQRERDYLSKLAIFQRVHIPKKYRGEVADKGDQ